MTGNDTTPSCVFCDETIVGTMYQRVEGWAKIRDKGTNSLRRQELRDVFACRACIDLADLGIDRRNQTVLF